MTDDKSDKPSFEAHLSSVEEAIRRLERGDIPLEDSIDLYADAMGHLKECHQVLDRAEKRLEIVRQGTGGTLEATPAETREGDGLQPSG